MLDSRLAARGTSWRNGWLLSAAAMFLALSGHAQEAKPAADAKPAVVRPKKARVAPVPRSERTAKQNELLRGNSINVFATLARYEKLYESWQPFFRHVLYENSLTARDRELLILRIGWLCQAEYEWAQHAPMGRRAGLSDANIRQIMAGPSATGVTAHDKLLMVACDELHSDACISDATWDALTKTYSTNQMMDIVFTVGNYNLVSMALNSFGVEIERGRAGFPSQTAPAAPAGRGRGGAARGGARGGNTRGGAGRGRGG